MTSPPTNLLNNAMTVYEGCSSIADNSGNLLFYSNGVTVWNQNHQVMANGTNLNYFGSATSVLIVKKPQSLTEYLIFTARQGALCVANVNMAMAAGLGSVTSKCDTIFNNQLDWLGLAGVKHCNGLDTWVACSQNGLVTTFLVTSSGTNTVPIQSASSGSFSSSSAHGLRFSQDGTKLVEHNNTTNTLGYFSFNTATGVASNYQQFNVPFNVNAHNFEEPEFSPDCTKLFFILKTTLNNNVVYQWDLCSGSASLNTAPLYTFSCPTGYNLRLGPDGKIYISNGTSNISVINNPNTFGAGCGFVANALSVSPNNSWISFPNQVAGYIKTPPSPFTYTSSTLSSCNSYSFSAYNPSSCAATINPIVGFNWNFGDPGSGATNNSSQFSPFHSFSAGGTYSVQLVLYYNCGTDTLRQNIFVPGPTISANTTSINCANLGSATLNLTSGVGPFNYTWFPSLQTTSIATNLSPGSHTLVVKDLGLNCTYTTTTYFSPLVPLSGSISASQNITCFGGATGAGQINNLAGGSGNQNYLWTNGNQTSSISSPTNLSAGTWTITVTDALTACQVNSVLTISQPPSLVLNLSFNTPTACAGRTIVLTGTNSGGTPGYTYTWTNAPPSNSTIVSESIAGTYVYTLFSRDANQCLSSNTIALNFIANPTLSVSDVSICPLRFGTLTASGATSYTWTLSSTTLGLTGPTLTDNPLTDTQYTVVGSALGCTSIATASIILFPSPAPIIQSNSPRCEGTSLDVNASGGSIYQWSGPASFNSLLPFNTIPNLALNHGGTYNLTVTSVNGCTTSTSANLIVNPIPTVSAAGSTVCTSQTLTLLANSGVGANYNWTGPATFVSAVQNPTLANPALNRTGTYSVIATSVLGCTNIATTQVSVTSPPNLSVALSSNSLCAQAFNGSPNTITLTGIGANTYTLYTPNLIGASAPVSPTTSVYATPPFSSTLAVGTATLEGSNGVCTSTASFVFTVVPNPTVGVNSFTPVICAGQNFTYTSNGANSYVWTATTPNYTTYSNGGVAVAHPSINSVFSVYGSSLGCNSALQTSSITVNPIPTLTLSAASNSICLNENTKLSVAGTGTSFTWSPATGLSNTTNSAVVASPQVSQYYTVLVSVANCTNSANLFLTVLPLPKPMIDFVTPAVCLNDKISLKGSGGVLYEWRGPEHLYIQGQNPVFEALSSSYAGNYTLTVTDNNGCKSSTVTTVEILPAPSGYLSNFKEEACAPYCTTFNFLSSDKNKTIKSSWMINDQFLNGNIFSYCFNSAATYTINGSFTDETTNCKNTASYLLNVHPKPKADFIFSPKQPIEGQDEVLFTNNSSGDGNLSFNWYFNDNKGYSTTQKNTSYLYNEPGEYRVVLVSKNNWKCADTIIKVIKVESDFALYVPNAFTPNGDERNDVFLPVVRSVKKYDLKIFDRWGKMIFQTAEPSQGWDGTFNGVMCKQDVYIWKIHVVSLDGKEKTETGNVTSLPSE